MLLTSSGTGVREIWCPNRLHSSETVLWTLPGLLRLIALLLPMLTLDIREHIPFLSGASGTT